MVEFVVLCPQADFYISQAFSVCKLRKCHALELIETCEVFDFSISNREQAFCRKYFNKLRGCAVHREERWDSINFGVYIFAANYFQ